MSEYRCKHSRKIWVRLVEESPDGEVIDFRESELSLLEETTGTLVKVPSVLSFEVSFDG